MSREDQDLGEAPERRRMTRRLARAAESFHGVTYYSSEINRFTEDGFKGWWHAYFAYRLAPMGPVGVPVAASVFYNFAPRMIAKAIPGAWEIMAPEQVITRRDELINTALQRIFSDDGFTPVIAEAAELARAAVTDLDLAARPLAAATADRPWPTDPTMALWHACTVWREYRGESHNIALAAAKVSGVACHALMVASGHGNQPTISGIRGWTEDEWRDAVTDLQTRSLVDEGGAFTPAGSTFRAEVEEATDRLSTGPVARLGPDGAARLLELLRQLGDHLLATGEIAGVWPPPAVERHATGDD